MLSKKKYLFYLGVFCLLIGTIFSFEQLQSKLFNEIDLLINKTLYYSFWSIGISKSGIDLIAAGVSLLIIFKYYNKFPKQVFLYLSAGWILLFFVYVLKSAVNIPMTDDFAILKFLNNYTQSKDISKIFMQYDEDREFLIRFFSITLFHLKLFDYRILIVLANLSLLGTVIIFYKLMHPSKISKEMLLFLLVILIFNFEFYDAIVLTSGAMYHACSIFFVAMSLFFLIKNSNRNLFIAMLFSIAAVLNNGSGFIILLIGAVYLLFVKRRYHFTIWIISCAVIAFFYFHFYSTSKVHYNEPINLNFSVERIMRCILFSFTFMGNSTQFFYDITLPLVTGTIIWIYFGRLTIKKYYQQNPRVYCILLFLLLTSFIIPLVKYSTGIAGGLGIRYGIYSIMAISCCFIALFENTYKEVTLKIFTFIFFIVLLYHLSINIFFYPEVVIRKERLVAMLHNIRIGKPFVKPPYVMSYPNAELLIKEAVHNGYYFPDY